MPNTATLIVLLINRVFTDFQKKPWKPGTFKFKWKELRFPNGNRIYSAFKVSQAWLDSSLKLTTCPSIPIQFCIIHLIVFELNIVVNIA